MSTSAGAAAPAVDIDAAAAILSVLTVPAPSPGTTVTKPKSMDEVKSHQAEIGLVNALLPSQSLPSASTFLPSTIRAPPGLRVTVEGADRKRHTYNDRGEELGNDPVTGVYEEVEIEDMEFNAERQAYYYPCPCGDQFSITVAQLIDGEDLAACPSCSLIVRVIYDPEQFFESEPESESDDD